MITSVSNDKVKHIAALNRKAALRREEDVFPAEGIRLFEEVPADCIKEAYLTEEAAATLKERGHIDIDALFATGRAEYVSGEVFAKMSDVVTPQGALALVKRFGYSREDLLKGPGEPLIMILADVQDPGNLGTVLRTAEAADVSGVVLVGDCADIYSPKVVRSTMGAIFRLPFVIEEEMGGITGFLQSRGIKVWAAALDQAEVFSDRDYRAGTAFMVGNEGRGLKEEHIKAADGGVIIPMASKTESLNASVSAALLMYEAARQRGYGK